MCRRDRRPVRGVPKELLRSTLRPGIVRFANHQVLLPADQLRTAEASHCRPLIIGNLSTFLLKLINFAFASDNHVFLAAWSERGILIVPPNSVNPEPVSFHQRYEFIRVVES